MTRCYTAPRERLEHFAAMRAPSFGVAATRLHMADVRACKFWRRAVNAAHRHTAMRVPTALCANDDGDVPEVEVVVAHSQRATLRVGDVFLKIDADQSRTEVEVEVMALAPVPTPQILWHKPPVLALAAAQGTRLGHLGEPSTASSAAWAAAGAALRGAA